jgi:putative transposase
MSEAYTQLYIHLVWATWDRAPLLTIEMRQRVYAAIQAECRRLGGESCAVGGTEDHVHVLTRIPATLTVSKLAQQLKGSTSHLINHNGTPGTRLRWQGGYGAFSVSRRSVDSVREYILKQEEHHRTGHLNAALEASGSSGTRA